MGFPEGPWKEVVLVWSWGRLWCTTRTLHCATGLSSPCPPPPPSQGTLRSVGAAGQHSGGLTPQGLEWRQAGFVMNLYFLKLHSIGRS